MAMRQNSPFRPPGSPRPMCWPNIRRSRVEVRRPASEKMTIAPTMKPRAPAWMSARITIWPNSDQWSWVETTVSPVTQTAEVAVNRAASRSGWLPSASENGSISRIVPNRIRPAKAAMRIRPGRKGPRRARVVSTRRLVATRRGTRTTRSPAPSGLGAPAGRRGVAGIRRAPAAAAPRTGRARRVPVASTCTASQPGSVDPR